MALSRVLVEPATFAQDYLTPLDKAASSAGLVGCVKGQSQPADATELRSLGKHIGLARTLSQARLEEQTETWRRAGGGVYVGLAS